MSNLSDILNQLQAAVTDAMDQISTQQQQITDLTADNKALTADKASLTTRYNEAVAQIVILQKQLADAQNSPPKPVPGLLPPNPVASGVRVIAGKYVGDVWHFDATGIDLGWKLPTELDWNWDIEGGGKNRGFNIAVSLNDTKPHVVTLNGRYVATIQAVADTRPVITVASVADAMAALKPDTVIVFNEGEYTVNKGWVIDQPNVRINGSGSMFTWSNGATWAVNAENVRITGMDIDAPDANDSSPTIIRLNNKAKNAIIDRCIIHRAFTFVDGNGGPDGVFLYNNNCVQVDGLIGQLAWAEGTCWVVDGNIVANSTQQNVFRSTRAKGVNLYGNDLTNLDRRDVDPKDYAKTTITLQNVSWGWVEDNVLKSGPLQFGPLNNAGQANDTNRQEQCSHIVAIGNTVTGTWIEVGSGSDDVLLVDNDVTVASGFCIAVKGYNDEYQRGVTRLKIDQNTGHMDGTAGGFIKIDGPGAGFTMTDNKFTAPALVTGSHQSANVWIGASDLATFTTIDSNVWQKPVKNDWIGGIAAFQLGGGRDGNITLEQWNALPQVKGDVFG